MHITHAYMQMHEHSIPFEHSETTIVTVLKLDASSLPSADCKCIMQSESLKTHVNRCLPSGVHLSRASCNYWATVSRLERILTLSSDWLMVQLTVYHCVCHSGMYFIFPLFDFFFFFHFMSLALTHLWTFNYTLCSTVIIGFWRTFAGATGKYSLLLVFCAPAQWLRPAF